MVLAVSAEVERLLVQMFRKHAMHCVYHAIVLGRLEARTFDSESRPRPRRPPPRQHAGCRGSASGLLRTFVLWKISTAIRSSNADWNPGTHQIRIHLAEAGHPLCGEKVYNKPLFGKAIIDHSGAQRQGLHAAELGFKHPITGEEMMFKTPLPADMGKLLVKLGNREEMKGYPESSGPQTGIEARREARIAPKQHKKRIPASRRVSMPQITERTFG